jgi:hypothetical protein
LERITIKIGYKEWRLISYDAELSFPLIAEPLLWGEKSTDDDDDEDRLARKMT